MMLFFLLHKEFLRKFVEFICANFFFFCSPCVDTVPQSYQLVGSSRLQSVETLNVEHIDKGFNVNTKHNCRLNLHFLRELLVPCESSCVRLSSPRMQRPFPEFSQLH